MRDLTDTNARKSPELMLRDQLSVFLSPMNVDRVIAMTAFLNGNDAPDKDALYWHKRCLEAEHELRELKRAPDEFGAYQDAAHIYAAYPPVVSLPYVALGLAGEAGELANKVKKIIRDDGGVLTDKRRAELLDEAGDQLWYLAEMVTLLDARLNDVAAANLAKLDSRKQRGVLHGDGDNR